jgi:ATP-dependent helicase/nuclease subunit A
LTATRNSPTPQQSKAIEAQGASVVLSSGAGCGKTFVLTSRYLIHLKRDRARVGEIVAITFTDRAARQMRDRIRKAVAKELEANPTDESWRRHLRDLESAPVQTIHSFCGDLLRQFSVQAGIDPRFEVLEEILAENLRSEALKDTLQLLLLGETPAALDLRELVVLFGWHATVRAIQHLLKERDVAGWKQWLARAPKDVAAEWVGAKREALLGEWVDYLCAASPKIAHLINLFQSIPCRGPEMAANVELILKGLPKLAQATDLAAAVEDLCEAAKVGKERAKAWPSEEAYEQVKDAMTGFRGDLPGKLALFTEDPGEVQAAAIVGQRFLRVALSVVEAYQERKRKAGVVDFQDLLVLARDLVRDHSTVQKSVLKRYRFLLLDEMQDTDPVQMELVELLCGIGIRHDKLFAVGDAKQSIYMFRGADVSLFEKLRAGVPEDGRLSLTRNYRSQPAILHFVNALCGKRFPDYEPLEAHHPQAYAGSCVEFLWSVPPEDAGESAGDVRAREADAIARRINELLAADEDRVLEETGLRRVRPGDVVLLFRSMSNVATYEAALRKHGLDYYLVGGRAFFAQQEIYDILNLLKTLENPDDGIALAGTLRSPFACLSDDALVIIGLHPGGLWAGLHDAKNLARLSDEMRPRVDRIRQLLNDWRAVKDRLPIARLINRAVADTAYDGALQFEFLGDRKLANLWKLVDLARSFDRSGMFGLAEFIARLGELVTNQPREEQAATQPENADVIKIMSIHQAKGLEFPVVFVPDFAAATGGGAYSPARWDRRLGCLANPPDEEPPLFPDFPHRLGLAWDTVAEWRESLRVLYVACTRARDLLVISAGLKNALPANAPADRPVPVKGANAWMLALGERFHLVSGECLDTAVTERPKISVKVVEPTVGLPPSLAKPQAAVPVAVVSAKYVEPIPPPSWPAVVTLDELEGRQPRPRWDLEGEPPSGLAAFAASEWPARLRAAEELHRDVDFLCPWPRGEGPMVEGSIDFLWKEADGWHLLAIGPAAEAGRRVEAHVVERQFGGLKSASVFELETGETRAIARSEDWAALERMLQARVTA